MYIARIEFLNNRTTPYVQMTIDTGLSVKSTTLHGAIKATVEWLKMRRFAILPSILNHKKINDINFSNYLCDSRDECEIREWIDSNKVEKCLVKINEVWLDPSTGRWLVKAETYDKTLDYLP